jgi:hypothetical protein
MPLLRYFFFVGGVLLALLFASGAYAPQSSIVSSTETGVSLPVIRIHSDRKWPEPVVFNTSIPTVTPMSVAKAEADASALATATVTDVSPDKRVGAAFAQFTPPDAKRPETKLQYQRKIAKNRVAAPTVLAAQRSGIFDNRIW